MRILQSLRTGGHRTALVQDGKKLSYAELDTWSSGVAAELSRRGLSSETPIGLLAPSSFAYFAGWMGIWKAGAIAVPLQPAHPAEELRYIIEDSGLSTILVHQEFMEQARSLQGSATLLPLENPNSSPHTGLSPQAEHGALMIYTSGTTGRPKGVLSTYATVEAQMATLSEAWQWSSEDRTLHVLPLHHIHGVIVLAGCALRAGAQMELAPKFSPQLVWDRISTGAINVFMAVPTVYARLVQFWKEQPEERRQSLSEGARRMRLMASGSAALPVPLFESWREISGQNLLERYGMTEIGIVLSNSYRGARHAGYVGHPLPGVQVRLGGADGSELQVRGPTLFREYWRRPEATVGCFTADGWFKTGDVAEWDEARGYKILGRSSQDILKSGGYKISALEIESRLLEHPQIREAAVIGVPDEVWGERVAAVLVSEKSLGENEIEGFLSPRLARYKIPTLWRFESSLPRNAMGKVLKSALRTLF